MKGPQKLQGLLGTGRRGGGVIYLSVYCHYQNDSCIKMGSDESHFNVSFIVRDEVTRQCPQNHNAFEEKGEPKRYRTEILLLTSLTPYSGSMRIVEVAVLGSRP